MKISVTITPVTSPTAPVLLGGDFVDSIKKAKTYGYDAIEIHVKDPAIVDAELIASTCAQLDMTVSGIATGQTYVTHKLSFIDDSEEIVAAAIERVKDYGKLAAALKSNLVIGCVRGNITDREKYPIYEKRLAEATRIVAEDAAKKNVPVVIEAINRFENNFLNTVQDTYDFIKKYDLPNVKILADTFHMNIEEQNMMNCLRKCGDLIGYVHIADNNRNYPGHGQIDFKTLIQVLREIGYDGYLSAEYLPLPDGDTAAIKGIQYMRSIM